MVALDGDGGRGEQEQEGDGALAGQVVVILAEL